MSSSRENIILKKVLYIAHIGATQDGRTHRLLDTLKRITDVYYLAPDANPNEEHQYILDKPVCFILADRIVRDNSIDIVFADNRMACMETLYLIFKRRNILVIQDSRELYMIESRNSLKSNIGTMVERILMRKADYVICANRYRADYIENHISLKNKPIVYENIRKLGTDLLNDEYIKKYRWLLNMNKPIVISTSGATVERTNDRLVREFAQFDDNMVLLLVGGEPAKDKKIIEAIIREKNLKNVFILGRVSQGELQFLISHSFIGIVNYGNFDINNKYCASGKIYEFLYEGIPVVTTSNAPLSDMCNKFGIGVATEKYTDGILEVNEHYEKYREKVKLFTQKDWIEENDNRLLSILSKIVEGAK